MFHSGTLFFHKIANSNDSNPESTFFMVQCDRYGAACDDDDEGSPRATCCFRVRDGIAGH